MTPEILYADGYHEGYADAETGRSLTDLSGYAADWRAGYLAGQSASWLR